MKSGSTKPFVTLGAAVRTFCLMTAALTLGACGHSSSNNSSFTIGGTVSGLSAGSSVELANGAAVVTVTAPTTTSTTSTTTLPTFTFPGTFPAGTSYLVTVVSAPAGELCEVTGNGSGSSLAADLTDVVVTCSDYGQWTWEGGLSTTNAAGVYGTQGNASVSNLPGARYSSSAWTDSSSTFWLFGGYGYGAAGVAGYLNDLWHYSPSTGVWTWVAGSNGDDASGIYGTLGTAAATNAPGGRYAASSWTDSSGNLWLFGGYGYDSSGNVGYLNDLWRYSASTGLWTWVSGGNAANAAGVYGALGAAAAGNVPGARYSASSWIDASGNLWLFGGVGHDATGVVGNLNDLWQFNATTGQWTWISGGNAHNAGGVYGTLGVAATSNVPGARQAASGWTDSSGNFWLFGGYGYDDASSGTSTVGYLSDLWQYSPSTGTWTWINGGSGNNASGVYGTQGSAAAAGTAPNVVGSRQAANVWIDPAGNFWLFGGYGYDSSGNLGALNDLWRYAPSTGQWVWMIGNNEVDATGSYGTQGTISNGSAPGGRQAAVSWIDSTAHLWLFGGAGFGPSGDGYLNDLWQFTQP